MKKSLASLLAGVALIGASAAQAYDGFVGINYINMEQHNQLRGIGFLAGEDRFTTGDIMVRVGGQINEYFLSELRLGATALPEEDGALRFGNDYYVGPFVRVQKPMGIFTPYAGIGYMWLKERLKVEGGGSATERLGDMTYGIGFDLALGERLGLNAEFFVLSYDGEPRGQIDRKGPSLGVFYKF
ncbi:MAG: hypothetical protein CVV10_08780 [Gammaproteobacteria bacterium HGW-Gammaproteobacteria-14]|nr:MAG: hypothetical protein CVV10_08780 [Gammaproteobacteria bacterium HGW-Gammaproteobacteria-14]